MEKKRQAQKNRTDPSVRLSGKSVNYTDLVNQYIRFGIDNLVRQYMDEAMENN